MDALSRMRKAPVTLPGWEQVNILRDPPRSIHTRKKERVEAGDITHNLREMGDRTSDSIMRFARGQNPMVSVSYSNHGTNASGVEASNPYKAIRDGAFRPPILRPVEDLQALSRRQFARPARQTAKGVNVANFQFKNLSEQTIDKQVLKGSIAPRTTRNIAGQAIETYVGNSILDPLQYSVASKISSKLSSGDTNKGDISKDGYIKDPLQYSVSSKISSKLSSGDTNKGDISKDGYIKDRENLSTYTNKRVSTSNGQMLDYIMTQKTKDYLWSAIEAVKSTPLFTKNQHGYAIDPNALKQKIESKNGSTNRSGQYTRKVNVSGDSVSELQGNRPMVSTTTNRRGQYMRKVDVNGDSVPELLGNRPTVSTTTNKRGNTATTSISRDIRDLELNRPSVSGVANRRMLTGAADHERTNLTASNIEKKARPRYGSYQDRVVIGAKGIRYNEIPDLPNKDPRKGTKLQQPPYTIENETITTRNGYGALW